MGINQQKDYRPQTANLGSHSSLHPDMPARPLQSSHDMNRPEPETGDQLYEELPVLQGSVAQLPMLAGAEPLSIEQIERVERQVQKRKWQLELRADRANAARLERQRHSGWRGVLRRHLQRVTRLIPAPALRLFRYIFPGPSVTPLRAKGKPESNNGVAQ